SFMEDVTDIINGNVDYFDNIVSNIVQVEIMVNSLGVPVSETVVNPNMIRQPLGSICINVRNQNGGSSIDLTGRPFAIISPQGNGLIKIDKVLNLKQNQKYILTLLFF